ncbi:hypothetical protein [Sphingomonas yantingensis]|uniref:Phage shock protein B n=1 Tax=Sphingomonas yantingensis TaxID=1241761 RepID=A0A7W9EIJ6_9SPHN|nr:hypothetical protein [Sphingomonas yantingensis]MBB5699253.1 hypothetical protein [Sphingomonas yantingensis]
MDPFSMVVGIVAVVTVGKIVREKVKTRESQPAADHPDAIRMREEVRTLKERVAVLERVVTDSEDSVRLDREIARLRDPRD